MINRSGFTVNHFMKSLIFLGIVTAENGPLKRVPKF